ncbi:MAG: dihydroneopterin aldolase [Prevotella sp.]|nr:dihydroneopterin aldolase [Prevotella sp.]
MKPTKSHIALHRLRFHAYHGVLEQERAVGNDYEVTVTLQFDIGRAARTDDVADTLNYAEVYETVKKTMAERRNLLESVAWNIGKALLEQFPAVESAKICVVKKNPPMGADCDGAEVHVELKKTTN